jgi:maltooligosyltrehalose trehalohydrolase
VDSLRLDAVHAIYDFSARPFLQELADAVRLDGERLNRRVHTIAESSLSDARLIAAKEMGGCGIDGQWCDDLHHAIRTELTDERGGYYADYSGFEDIVKAYRQGFVQDGAYSPFRGRRHGNSARHVDPVKLVVCSQNHDQVGNRLIGERLTELVSFEQLKLAAATVILATPTLSSWKPCGADANRSSRGFSGGTSRPILRMRRPFGGVNSTTG